MDSRQLAEDCLMTSGLTALCIWLHLPPRIRRGISTGIRTKGKYLFYVLCMVQFSMIGLRGDDRSATTIIAKLVAFLFVQDSVRSNTKFT